MHPQSKPTAAVTKQFESLRKHGLAYPETHEDHPWGHSALKVRGKAFAFLWADGEGMSISVKLPESNALALNLPFAEPTGYGLGKSGWVTARFGNKDKAPLEVLFAWLDESFRAVAPKKLVAALAQGKPAAGSPKAMRSVRGGQKTERVATKKPAKAARSVKGGQKTERAATKKPVVEAGGSARKQNKAAVKKRGSTKRP